MEPIFKLPRDILHNIAEKHRKIFIKDNLWWAFMIPELCTAVPERDPSDGARFTIAYGDDVYCYTYHPYPAVMSLMGKEESIVCLIKVSSERPVLFAMIINNLRNERYEFIQCKHHTSVHPSLIYGMYMIMKRYSADVSLKGIFCLNRKIMLHELLLDAS